MQQPRDGELRHGRLVPLRDLVELAAGLREFTRGNREPRNESELVLLAVIHYVLTLARGEVVLVLHTDDLDDLARLLDLRHRHFAEADVANLSLLLQLLRNAERFLDGRLR